MHLGTESKGNPKELEVGDCLHACDSFDRSEHLHMRVKPDNNLAARAEISHLLPALRQELAQIILDLRDKC